MEVTNDEYELPLAVSDSIRKLALLRNANPDILKTTFSNIRKGRIKSNKWKIVEYK